MSSDSNQEIIILDNLEDLAETAIKIFIDSANETKDPEIGFNAAISGGSTPRLMHRKLAIEPYITEMAWQKLHLFWVDERCVSIYDEASNYGAAKRDMLDEVPLSERQLHPMPVEIEPENGALRYEEELAKHFGLKQGELPTFDLIVLGVGTDGHTASLFPGQSTLEEKDRLVLAVRGGNPNVYRLTLTFPIINQARKILVLIAGKVKAEIVKKIFQESGANLPVQSVHPVKGKLIWLLDQDSASLL